MTCSLREIQIEMNFHLSFSDGAERVQDVWEANFEAEHTAICWMWMVGGVWALKRDWSTMELSCERCSTIPIAACPRASTGNKECRIARVPAEVLRPSSKSERRQPRTIPIVLIVERDDVIATSYESTVLDAGFCVGACWPDYASAGKWLSAHTPDTAILDVKPQDKTCVALAEKLSAREIPFLALSNYPAGTPGLNRIFQSVPWLEKPVTPTGLQLALRSIL
jgi:hypothetical protein